MLILCTKRTHKNINEIPDTVSATSVADRVSDPHEFNADPDTDPDPGFDDLKLKKIYSWKFNFYFLDQKLQFTYP